MSYNTSESSVEGFSTSYVPSAISPLLRHVMIYGVMSGIFFGIIGQFVFGYFIKEELLSTASLSQDFAWRMIVVELISLIVILVILITILSFRWKAPSRRAKLAHGLLIGCMFAITTHVVFVSNVNGALYNRAMWNGLQHNYNEEDPVFLGYLLESIWRCVTEGTAAALLFIVILSLVGAIFTFLFVTTEEQTIPMKDASGAFATLLIPMCLYIAIIFNIVVLSLLPSQMEDAEAQTSIEIYPYFIVTIVIIPPFLMLCLSQIAAIIWLINHKREEIHRRILRVVQLLYLLVIGILVWPIMTIISPGFMNHWWGFGSAILIMLLTWVFAILVQVKFYRYKVDAGQRTRPPFRSVLGAFSSMLLITYLMIDLFSVRIPLNMVSYAVELIEEGTQHTINPSASIDTILYQGVQGNWFLYLPYLVAGLCIIILIFTPFLWLINRFER